MLRVGDGDDDTSHDRMATDERSTDSGKKETASVDRIWPGWNPREEKNIEDNTERHLSLPVPAIHRRMNNIDLLMIQKWL